MPSAFGLTASATDPVAKNQFEYGVSVSGAVWNQATTACKDLQPPGTLSGKRTPKQQSASLRLAQCVRDNGVKDFPDPANGEPLVNTYRIRSRRIDDMDADRPALALDEQLGHQQRRDRGRRYHQSTSYRRYDSRREEKSSLRINRCRGLSTS